MIGDGINTSQPWLMVSPLYLKLGVIIMWLPLKHSRTCKCIYSILVSIWLGVTFKLLHNELRMFK